MLKMVELDHRLVVVGGLIVACLFYQVPLYTVLVVVVIGCAVYLRNKYKRGWRVYLGLDGLQFTRQTRGTRLRNAASASQRPSPTLSTSKVGKNVNFPTSTGPWGKNVTLKVSPALHLVYSNYNCRENVRSRFPLVGSSACQSHCGQNTETISPVYSPRIQTAKLATQRTSCAESGMELTLNKPDTAYDAICQEKYVGVGIYPLVNLDPSRLGLLSHVNSSMTRNKVTVKVAPPERITNLKHRIDFLRCQLSGDSFDKNRDIVLEALRSERKRPIKGDTLENTTQKRQKTEAEPAVSPPVLISSQYPSPPPYPVPNGILPQFDSSIRSELTNAIPSSFETLADESSGSFNKKPPVFARAQTNAIFSSYSSSQKMTVKVHPTLGRMKRKSQMEAADMPEKKLSKSSCEASETEECNIDSLIKLPNEGVNTATNDIVERDKSWKATEQEAAIDEKKACTFNSMPVMYQSDTPLYIPSHIPTLKDYLEDQKTNHQRLQKLLSSFSSHEGKTEEATVGLRCDAIDLVIDATATAGPSMQTVNHFVQPAPSSSAPTATVTTASQSFSFGVSRASALASNDQKSTSTLTLSAHDSEISDQHKSAVVLNKEQSDASSVKLSLSGQFTVPSTSLLPAPAVGFGTASTNASVLPAPATSSSSPKAAIDEASVKGSSLPLSFTSLNVPMAPLKTVASSLSTTSNVSKLPLTTTPVSVMLPNSLSAPVASLVPSQAVGTTASTWSLPVSTSTSPTITFPTVALSPSSSSNVTRNASVPSYCSSPALPHGATHSVMATPSTVPLSSCSSGTVGFGTNLQFLQTSSSVLPLQTSSSTKFSFGNQIASTSATQAPNSPAFQLDSGTNSIFNSSNVQSNVKSLMTQNSAKISVGSSVNTTSPQFSSTMIIPTFSSSVNSGQKMSPGLFGASSFSSPSSVSGSGTSSVLKSQTTKSVFGGGGPTVSTNISFGAGNTPKMSFPTALVSQQPDMAGNGPVYHNNLQIKPFVFGSNTIQPSADSVNFGSNNSRSSIGGFSFGNNTAMACTVTSPTTTSITAAAAAPSAFGGTPGTTATTANANLLFNSQPPPYPSINGPFQSSNVTSSDNSVNASKPFVFGSSTSSNQGFNFNPTAKPSFNFVTSNESTTPVMFTFGSGSTSARPRKTTASRLRYDR